MKKIAFLILLAICTGLTACKNTNNKKPEIIEETDSKVSETVQPPKVETKTEKPAKGGFDINNIVISDSDLGNFPFFGLPNGLELGKEPVIMGYDILFFPIDSVMTPIEGKTWKALISLPRESEETWSLAYFKKSYDDAIKTVGGVKIFDGKVSKEELDRIHEDAYFGTGSIDYWNEPASVYIIRRANGEDVYIQLSGNSVWGQLQVLQKTAFEQTIKMLKSDQIRKDLNAKGKAVLYINFDTDKATLKHDGTKAVAEISKALQSDTDLNISIYGFTDNTGNDAHNLQLSKDRAETVKKAIIASGIDENRLSSDGFGSKNPIAENSTEDGKARNRRVELIKK